MSFVKTTNGEGAKRKKVLDEDLNSRNIFAYGLDAMTKMARSKVAVIGLNGVGAEAAKSLILANIGTVTLVDNATVAMKDLSTHFYLSETDIGRNRAEACHLKLQELNPNVSVELHTEAVTLALLAQHTAVVVCDGTLSQHVEWNTMCRTLQPAVAFVLAEARGVCFRLFSDFGPEPYDSLPGHPTYCIPVEKVEPAAAGHVTVTIVAQQSDIRPEFGHIVTFSGISGAMNGQQLPIHFRVVSEVASDQNDLWHFDVESIDHPHQIEACSGNFHVKRLITPDTFSFCSLSDSLLAPGNLSARAWNEFALDGRSEQLHVAFAALHHYAELNHGSHPDPRKSDDSAAYAEQLYTH